MCSGSEAGSYSRLIDGVYHSTPGSRIMQKEGKRLVVRGVARKALRQLFPSPSWSHLSISQGGIDESVSKVKAGDGAGDGAGDEEGDGQTQRAGYKGVILLTSEWNSRTWN